MVVMIDDRSIVIEMTEISTTSSTEHYTVLVRYCKIGK